MNFFSIVFVTSGSQANKNINQTELLIMSDQRTTRRLYWVS